MQKIAVTGLSGEIGRALLKEFKGNDSEIIDLNRSYFDLLQPEKFAEVLGKIQPKVIIHLAGSTHIDSCEADKVNGKEGLVWRTNVTATKMLADECAKKNIHLIYLSTECVFNGKKKEFFEDDVQDPINWYGETKKTAEKNILDSKCLATILRAVIAYSPEAKNTLWQKIDSKIKKEGSIKMANDHWMTPTYLPDISRTVLTAVEKSLTGIFHITPAEVITPFSFAQNVAEAMGYSKQVIIPATLSEIIGEQKAASRLEHACLNSRKTEQELGFTFNTIKTATKNI